MSAGEYRHCDPAVDVVFLNPPLVRDTDDLDGRQNHPRLTSHSMATEMTWISGAG
ncbi:MAG: hypothetical protein J0H99_15480 [Rhodospirillales bacterium]|nr:hypothetical protein [Rhodospirillales bacterium]